MLTNPPLSPCSPTLQKAHNHDDIPLQCRTSY